MKCPNCQTAFNIEWDYEELYPEDPENKEGVYVQVGQCPECLKCVVVINRTVMKGISKNHWETDLILETTFAYPPYVRTMANEVPEQYRIDYLESCGVISQSAKASAALSRRLLQRILEQEYKIKKRDLSNEINDFIALPNAPTTLKDAVDAIRNIGNFAAHPLKNTNTGEIVDVEPGESEWLLDVLDMLFDFTFIQPKKLEENKKRLNDKLLALGKNPMK